MEHVQERLSRKDRERLIRRREILSAAQEVIAEKGYNEATLEEIAARAEYGKGTLYNYFPGGKQEILLSIFGQFYDELCLLIAGTFPKKDPAPFKIQLHTFFEKTFDFFFERLDLFVTLLREAHRLGFSDDAGPRKFFESQRTRALAALSAPLERAMQHGEIRRSSPRFLAHMILVNINGCQMKACGGPSPTDIESPDTAKEMADFLTSLVYDGLKNDGAMA